MMFCFIVNIENNNNQIDYKLLEIVCQNGVTHIQFRYKGDDLTHRKTLAQALNAFLAPYSIPLIINDDPFLAQEINAAGVHLGQTDMHPEKARHLLGKEKIIGLSVETAAELASANQIAEISYIAASAVFPTKSKSNCKTVWGIEGLAFVIANSVHPVIAIGGINEDNIQQVLTTGVDGVAVISAITDAKNPAEVCRAIHHAIRNQREKDHEN